MDKSGAIELREIRNMLKHFDPAYTEQCIRDILQSLDLDDSGKVSWAEFKRIFGMDKNADERLKVVLVRSKKRRQKSPLVIIRRRGSSSRVPIVVSAHCGAERLLETSELSVSKVYVDSEITNPCD